MGARAARPSGSAFGYRSVQFQAGRRTRGVFPADDPRGADHRPSLDDRSLPLLQPGARPRSAREAAPGRGDDPDGAAPREMPALQRAWPAGDCGAGGEAEAVEGPTGSRCRASRGIPEGT